MKLRRREIIGVAVLLLALVGYACDRLLFEPRAAIAATDAPDGTGAAELPGAGKKSSPTDNPADSLERLDRFLAETAEPGLSDAVDSIALVPDVFDTHRAPNRTAAPSAAVETVNSPRENAEKFRAEHRLTAVILGPRPLALVGDTALRVGQSVDGFQLKSIQATFAVFVSDGIEVVLQVPGPIEKPANAHPRS